MHLSKRPSETIPRKVCDGAKLSKGRIQAVYRTLGSFYTKAEAEKALLDFTEVTYEITDSVKMEIPMTGGEGISRWLMMIAPMLMMIGLYVLLKGKPIEQLNNVSFMESDRELFEIPVYSPFVFGLILYMTKCTGIFFTGTV